MPDSRREVEPWKYAFLFDAGGSPEPGWTPQEIRAILDHQLEAPLAGDFFWLGAQDRHAFEQLRRNAGPPIETFGDLLGHPAPPVELLKWTKEFAVSCVAGSDRFLPREVATVLYYGAVVEAILRCGERITSLQDSELRRRLQILTKQAWIPDATRERFGEGIRALRPA